MPKLYFHLRSNRDELLDPEGRDLPLVDVPSQVLREARSLIAFGAEEGRIDLRQRIDVEDSMGHVVHTLRLADAVDIDRPE